MFSRNHTNDDLCTVKNRRMQIEKMERRELMAGDVDFSFGNGWGFATTDFGGYDTLSSMTLQPDGKIVTIGSTEFGGGGINTAMSRYNSDGTLDTGFGGIGVDAGMVVTDVGQSHNGGFEVIVLEDGKLLVAGLVGTQLSLTRYLPNGAIDNDFGVLGTAIIEGDGHEEVHGLIEADGKLFFVSDFAVRRLNLDGTLDNEFGTNGTLALGDFHSAEGYYITAADQRGDTLVLGLSTSDTVSKIVKMNLNGSLDATFGSNGAAALVEGISHIEDVLLLADGSVVGVRSNHVSNDDIFKLTPGGSADGGFHVNGYFELSGYGTRQRQRIRALTSQPDGSLIAVGRAGGGAAALRLASDGSPDVNFGLNGWSYFPAFAVYMDSVLGYANGKVVLGGTNYAGDGDFILTKLNMDGPPQFEIPKGITTKPGLQVPIDLGKRLQLGSTQFAEKDSASEPRSKNPLAADNASTNRRPANSGLKVSDDVERERNIDAFFEELENSSRGLQHGISLNIAF